LTKWDELTEIYSREAVLKGSFDRYVESNKGKRGTAEVDAAFLAEIERWRELLARNIALRNPHLSQRELNFAVQHTIDRIIFLRICKDRGIEPHRQSPPRPASVVALVERMLSLHEQVAQAQVPHLKTTLQRQIEATDRQIDRLVYTLYGLTEDEIEIVEGG
jgi:hypothetical protein